MLPFGELLAACESDAASLESSKRLVLTWINYSQAELLPREADEYNDMHAFGFGLAYMLSKYDALGIRDRTWTDMPEALTVEGNSFKHFSCKQCLDFLRLLQVEYGCVLHFDKTVGYEADVDMTLLLLVIMQRLGDHLAEQVRMPEADPQRGVYELLPGESEWYVVSAQTRKECFNILHVLMRLFYLLLDAQPVEVDDELVIKYVKELSPFQYEASLHDFYNFSMVSDCIPASILVYKHEYKEMFNDPSQVIYFHQPMYKRQRQIDFESITSLSAGDINVLPIILQIKPDAPVFFEHTGACNSTACSTEPWSWLVIHRHVLLCDNNGRYYVAKNIYVLFAYLMSKCED